MLLPGAHLDEAHDALERPMDEDLSCFCTAAQQHSLPNQQEPSLLNCLIAYSPILSK
jgi:hypothetical protein